MRPLFPVSPVYQPSPVPRGFLPLSVRKYGVRSISRGFLQHRLLVLYVDRPRPTRWNLILTLTGAEPTRAPAHSRPVAIGWGQWKQSCRSSRPLSLPSSTATPICAAMWPHKCQPLVSGPTWGRRNDSRGWQALIRVPHVVPSGAAFLFSSVPLNKVHE